MNIHPTTFDRELLHDFVIVHGFGPPTDAGYELAEHLVAEGDDYATAAAQVVARDLTQDLESDEL